MTKIKSPAIDRLKKRMGKAEFTRENYFRAVALSHLSSIAHETDLMLDADTAIPSESGQAYSDLSSELHKQAAALFPLLPHDDFERWQRGKEWLVKEGIKK